MEHHEIIDRLGVTSTGNQIKITNKKIKNYEKEFNSMLDANNYYDIIKKGSEICDLIFVFVPKKNNDAQYFGTSPNFDIPFEYQLKFDIIKNTVKDITTSDDILFETLFSFLKRVNELLTWTFDNFSSNEIFQQIKIENCLDLIRSFLKPSPSEEDSFYIEKINSSLENLYKNLQLISFEDYSRQVFEAYRICELMTEFYLKKEDYTVNNRIVSYNKSDLQLIPFCIKYNIFPEECQSFLKLIYKNRNIFTHSDPSFDVSLTFLNTFKYFILWFDYYFMEKYKIYKPFKVEDCYSKMKFLPKSYDDYILKNLIQTINDPETRHNGPVFYCKGKTDDEKLLYSNDEKLLFNSLIKKINDLEKQIDKLKDSNTTLESRLNTMEQKVHELSYQLSICQSLIENLIKSANSEIEVNLLIKAYSEDCANKLLNHTETMKEEKTYKLEKTKLIRSFGEDAWNKMSIDSKNFLISSKIMYNELILIDDILDYSGVCILITKALECEIFNRFYTNFIKYLNINYNYDFQEYPTALLYNKRQLLYHKRFTMGSIAFVMCYRENWDDTDEEKENNKVKLLEYCKSCLFSKYEDNEIMQLLNKYASSIEMIRVKYRNPSAHRNKITKINAEDCFDLIVDVEKLLKKMLDSFDE